MFKKLFCKHNYRKYHESDYLLPLTGGWTTLHHFVCTKCQKNYEIDDISVRKTFEKYNIKAAKDRVGGEDQSLYKDLSYQLAGRKATGKAAYYLQLKLSKFEDERNY